METLHRPANNLSDWIPSIVRCIFVHGHFTCYIFFFFLGAKPLSLGCLSCSHSHHCSLSARPLYVYLNLTGLIKENLIVYLSTLSVSFHYFTLPLSITLLLWTVCPCSTYLNIRSLPKFCLNIYIRKWGKLSTQNTVYRKLAFTV